MGTTGNNNKPNIAIDLPSTRSCKTAPPALGNNNSRAARAAEFLQNARVRSRKKRAAASESSAAKIEAVCGAHGLPHCKKCSKTKPEQILATFEIENTSLNMDIAGAPHPCSSAKDRPTTGSSTSRSTAHRAPLSAIELNLQARLFRHKKSAIESACAKHGKGFLSRRDFSSLLGSLMLHPGEEDFSKLWREYDPKCEGWISSSSWLTRFVASVSLPDGCLPPCVITKRLDGMDSLGTQRSRCTGSGVPSSSQRMGTSRPRSCASRVSIDCGQQRERKGINRAQR